MGKISQDVINQTLRPNKQRFGKGSSSDPYNKMEKEIRKKCINQPIGCLNFETYTDGVSIFQNMEVPPIICNVPLVNQKGEPLLSKQGTPFLIDFGYIGYPNIFYYIYSRGVGVAPWCAIYTSLRLVMDYTDVS